MRQQDLLLGRPGLELLEALTQEDVVLLLRLVELVALGPVVADGVGEDDPGGVEGTAGDGLLHGLARLQLGARVLVPEGPPAVRAHRRQGAVDGMERNVVDGVDVLDALHRKLLRLIENVGKWGKLGKLTFFYLFKNFVSHFNTDKTCVN